MQHFHPSITPYTPLDDTPYNHLQIGDVPLQYREGFNPVTNTRISLPNYEYYMFGIYDKGVDINVLRWDPLMNPQHLMELRPGKNAIKFHWERDPADNAKWMNQMNKVNAGMGPISKYCITTDPAKSDNVTTQYITMTLFMCHL